MRIKSFAIVVLFSAVMWSCNKGDVRETPSGHKITYVKKGDGTVVKAGEVVVLNMAIVDQNDSIWYDNRPRAYPEVIKIADETQKETEPVIFEAFRMLSKGDSVHFGIKAKEFFTKVWRGQQPAAMDDEAMFTFQIGCRQVLDEASAASFQASLDSVQYAKQMKEAVEYNTQQLAKDIALIDNYLAEKGMKASTLPSGLRYVLKAAGRGNTIQAGDYITVKYAGETLDGNEFDSGEYPFTVGQGSVIQGWDEIAQSMKEGTSLTVFIPSTMAYGRGGRPPVIMPDAILVFDMEILSVKKN